MRQIKFSQWTRKAIGLAYNEEVLAAEHYDSYDAASAALTELKASNPDLKARVVPTGHGRYGYMCGIARTYEEKGQENRHTYLLDLAQSGFDVDLQGAQNLGVAAKE